MENETLKMIYALATLPYGIFIIWLGSKLFTKWLPLINKVKCDETFRGSPDEIIVFDLSNLTRLEKIKFFYVRMVIEAGMIIALVILGANHPKTQYVINNHLWRGNWMFPLFVVLVSVLFVTPLFFIV